MQINNKKKKHKQNNYIKYVFFNSLTELKWK